jgi:glycosyltransferase involved in cell wall biosynthesis
VSQSKGQDPSAAESAARVADLEKQRDEERAWMRDELSLTVRSRRQLEDELDQANAQLAATRLEASRLRARRSVRIALRLAAAARSLRSLTSRRTAAPTTRPGRDPGIRSFGEAKRNPTPDEFRSNLQDRLGRPNDVRPVIVERAAAAVANPSTDEMRMADILAVSTADLDIRTVRGRAVTVALVGTDWQEWLGRPWLDDFDIVATSDPASVEAIGATHAKAAVLVPDPRASVNDLVAAWLAARRIGIAIGIPRWVEAPAWGDLHFARALQRQFERRGHPTRVHILPDWSDEVSARDDVSIHLFGLSARPRLAGQMNLLWVISHPGKVTDELISAYDRIYVASDVFGQQLAERTSIPVTSLHQATDPERFHPDRTGPRHEILFVGNSRGMRRDILADLMPTSLGLAVYGQWTPERLDPAYLYDEHIPNEDLNRYYSSADVVLNDHWADMRAAGFFSNRLYDALASGACVVSDHVDGIEAEFDGGVVTYTDAGELRLVIRDLLVDPGRRQALADRGRAAVLARHTFEGRVDRILADIEHDPSPAPR